MEKEYVRELDHAYLVLGDCQIDEDEYVLQMAMRGRLSGILPLSIAGRDGKKLLRADVTACTSITSRFRDIPLTAGDIRKILSAIRDTAQKMPGLLMSVRDLYLDPECVFLGAGGDEVLVCYIPHISDTEPDSVRLLSEFLLKKLDHSDQAATQLAYTLYDQVSQESYVLTDILQNLLQGGGNMPPGSGREPASTQGRSRSGSGEDLPGRPGFRDDIPGRAGSGESISGRSGADRGAGSYGGHNAGSFGSHNVESYSGHSSGSYGGHSSGSFDSHSAGFYSGHSTHSGNENSGRERKIRDEFSGSNIKKLPPPGKKKHSGNSLRSGGRSGTSGKPARISRRLLIPILIILPAACAAIVIFRMDLTQILGMGFLCAALIWMIHSSLEKYSSEGRNVWYDDENDPESDDRFYQSLRQELYAENPDFSQQGFQSAYSPESSSLRNDHEHMQGDSLSRNDYEHMQGDFSDRGSRAAMYGDHGSRMNSESEDERTRMLGGRKPVLVSLQPDRCGDITIRSDHLILGTSRTQADIVLPGDTVSRKHARIEQRTDGYYVTDLFSTNGTFLDGHRLESGHAVSLKDGAQLTIASLHYRVTIPASA